MKMIGFQLCNIIPHYAGRHFCEWDAPGFTLKRLDGFFGDPEVSGSSCGPVPPENKGGAPSTPLFQDTIHPRSTNRNKTESHSFIVA